MRLVFDIEANGLDDASLIHCLVATDLNTGTTYEFEPSKVEQGFRLLMSADQIIGHNIIGYDLPLITKLYPWFTYDRAKVIDTLILSRLIWTNLGEMDRTAVPEKKPDGDLTGSHGLKAWGQRFGNHKVEHEDWSTFSPEMLDRCKGDVDITVQLWQAIEKAKVDPRASELEHAVAFICAQQERYGFTFDEPKAQQLAAHFQSKLANLEQELQDTIAPFYLPDGKVLTSKRTTNGTKRPSTTAGAEYQKIKLVTFNPGSRHHIADRLKKLYGWEPTVFTPSGQPQVDEVTLSKLVWPEAKLLTEYFLMQKRLGLLIGKDEDKGWLNVVTKGKIHGRVITNGAVTGRMTHRLIANIPRVTSPYGRELRELFTASPDRCQVGIDVSGLELRMLAHFLAAWDAGAYGKEVCEGDVHTYNMIAAGLATRDQAKTFCYGWLYGAGATKLGSIAEPTADEVTQTKIGKRLKKAFASKIPGIPELLRSVEEAAKRGYLKGLDGRKIPLRSPHSALNFLLQGAGAVVCKRWVVELDNEVERRGWRGKAQSLIVYHDETQYEVDPEIAEEFGKVAVMCIARAGEYFGIRIPLTGEYKVGRSWADCH